MTGPSDDHDQEALVPMDDLEIRADQYDAIEEIATRTGVDRSAVVRRLLALGIAQARQSDDDKKKPS
jgi:hypothetical protein